MFAAAGFTPRLLTQHPFGALLIRLTWLGTALGDYSKGSYRPVQSITIQRLLSRVYPTHSTRKGRLAAATPLYHAIYYVR